MAAICSWRTTVQYAPRLPFARVAAGRSWRYFRMYLAQASKSRARITSSPALAAALTESRRLHESPEKVAWSNEALEDINTGKTNLVRSPRRCGCCVLQFAAPFKSTFRSLSQGRVLERDMRFVHIPVHSQPDSRKAPVEGQLMSCIAIVCTLTGLNPFLGIGNMPSPTCSAYSGPAQADDPTKLRLLTPRAGDGDYRIVPPYVRAPELTPREGVPTGIIYPFT